MHPILVTPDGIEINVDLINSEASQNIARQPQLIGFVKEALAGKRLAGPEIRVESDLGRVIGYDFIVATDDDDDIFYAQIVHEDTFTRFVKHKKPFKTQQVALVLKRSANDKDYELQAARIGCLVPPRPGTPGETSESRSYWATHAFVSASELFQLRTISKECPY